MSEPCGAVDCEGPEMECHCVEPPVPLCKHQAFIHFSNITANPHTIKPYKSKVGIQDAAEIMSAVENLLYDTRKTKAELLESVHKAKKAIEKECKELMEIINEAEKLCQDLKLALSEDTLSTKDSYQNFIYDMLLQPKDQRDRVFRSWKAPKLNEVYRNYCNPFRYLGLNVSPLEISSCENETVHNFLTRRLMNENLLARNLKSLRQNSWNDSEYSFLGSYVDLEAFYVDTPYYEFYLFGQKTQFRLQNIQSINIITTLKFQDSFYLLGFINPARSFDFTNPAGPRENRQLAIYKQNISDRTKITDPIYFSDFPDSSARFVSATTFRGKIYFCARNLFIFHPEEGNYSTVTLELRENVLKFIFGDEFNLYILEGDYLYKLFVSIQCPNKPYVERYQIQNPMSGVPISKPFKFRNKFYFLFDRSKVFSMSPETHEIKEVEQLT